MAFVHDMPAWSPSSRWVVFQGTPEGHDCFFEDCPQAIVMEVETGELQILPQVRRVAWSRTADVLVAEYGFDGGPTARLSTYDPVTQDRIALSSLEREDPTRDSGAVWR